MKKVLIIVLLLFLISFEKEETAFVLKQTNNEFQKYEITFEDKVISTNNFKKYFKNNIISISPYVNNLYNKLINLNYQFDYRSMDGNLTKFKNKYIKTLEEKGFKKDALEAKLNGIFIKKVILYSSSKDISYLNSQFNIKIINI
ncbi:MAG: hypothetical protein RSB71_00935 [Bacilli bacterium]